MPQTQRFGSEFLNKIQSNRQKQLLSTLSPNLVVLSLSSEYSVEVSLRKKSSPFLFEAPFSQSKPLLTWPLLMGF